MYVYMIKGYVGVRFMIMDYINAMIVVFVFVVKI